MIEMLCLGGPLNGRRVMVPAEQKLTFAQIREYAQTGDVQPDDSPAFGSGYYAPQNRQADGRNETVLRWEGEL